MGTESAVSRRECRRMRRRERGLWWTFKHRVQPLITRPFMWVNLRVFPRLYLAYMGLVWRTSTVLDLGIGELHSIIAKHGGAVGLLWHEEVMTVAYAYHRLGFRPTTLASLSNDGDVVTRILELCGFRVFRGGSSRRRSRNRLLVARDMIEHMRSRDDVIFGLTVDGSKGPPYRLKRGGLVIARECGRPIVLVRTWYKRSIRMATWDRTAIPLPFNRIHHTMRGPYFVPADADTREGMERFRLKLQRDLIELAARSYDELGQTRPAALAPPREAGLRNAGDDRAASDPPAAAR